MVCIFMAYCDKKHKILNYWHEFTGHITESFALILQLSLFYAPFHMLLGVVTFCI